MNNKIAISLALVAVCIGVVAAGKQFHSEDHEANFAHAQHHSSRFDVSNCEEECNYVCRRRYHPGHEYGHGYGNGLGQGQGTRPKHGKGSQKGGKGRNQQAKQIDFFPSGDYIEGPFYPNTANTGDNGFHSGFDFPGGDFVEHGHPIKPKKQSAKRGSSKKSASKKNNSFQFAEAQGGKFAEADLERSQFDFAHESDDTNQTTEKKKVRNKDVTFIRDKSSEAEDTSQSSNEHHQFDGFHGSNEQAHGFAAN